MKITPTEWIYEAARLEAIASNRKIVPEIWSKRDEKFRLQMTEYVEGLRGKPLPTPEEAHNSWWRKYEEMGWKYGEVRDIIAKTHPDMVPFGELPKDEQDKDEIFLALVEFAFKFIKMPFKELSEGSTHHHKDACYKCKICGDHFQLESKAISCNHDLSMAQALLDSRYKDIQDNLKSMNGGLSPLGAK